MNWFEYKMDSEFIAETFSNKTGSKWPRKFKEEYPEKTIKQLFCKHRNLTNVSTIYFRPDDGNAPPPVITDRLIEEHYKVHVCIDCGKILNREKIGSGQTLPSFS